MEDKIKEAVKLLQETDDYVVIKLSKQQVKDYKDCGSYADDGGQKDCSECSCSACVIE